MPIWEVIGWIGSSIIVISMLQQRITRLRSINLVGCLISATYAAAIGAWPLFGLNVVLALIQVVSLAKLLRGRHDPAAYAAVEVEPSGELVAHVVARHETEIRQLNPSFTTPAASDSAYAVLAGDELVGLVLVSRAGTTARIDLDFVTAAYRDFTPGEFVFRRSAIWRDHGIDRIVTTSDGPDYYERLGFTPVDGAWELNLATRS